MSERTVDLIRKDMQSAKNEAKKNILLPVREVEDLLALVDSLQQQVHSLNEESLSNFRTAAERGKQLAERDRTIARQSAALETATDALNSIVNGEWSETIDDQFLEVWTTRRINPSQIADEALLAIGQELDALGE